MDIYLVKNVINWVNLVKNRSFLVKMVKIGSFWGQNEATDQNLGKAIKFFFSLNFSIMTIFTKKMTYCDQFKPINDIFEYSYVY